MKNTRQKTEFAPRVVDHAVTEAQFAQYRKEREEARLEEKLNKNS